MSAGLPNLPNLRPNAKAYLVVEVTEEEFAHLIYTPDYSVQVDASRQITALGAEDLRRLNLWDLAKRWDAERAAGAR